MKILLIVTIFLTNILFANYAYTGDNSGKIDMHGGKSDNLMGAKNSLGKVEGLKNIGEISKPITPVSPTPLINQDETKEEKTKEVETK